MKHRITNDFGFKLEIHFLDGSVYVYDDVIELSFVNRYNLDYVFLLDKDFLFDLILLKDIDRIFYKLPNENQFECLEVSLCM